MDIFELLNLILCTAIGLFAGIYCAQKINNQFKIKTIESVLGYFYAVVCYIIYKFQYRYLAAVNFLLIIIAIAILAYLVYKWISHIKDANISKPTKETIK